MSSRRTEPRSIAAQLVLLFTLAATLLLFCGLGAFYWIVVRHAFAENNAVLADKISGLSADFRESGPRIFGEELKAHRAGDHAPYWIRILDSEGHTVTETAGMERFVPPSVFPPAQKSTSSIGGSKDYRTGAKLFSLVAVNEKTGGQTYTIQVAHELRTPVANIMGEAQVALTRERTPSEYREVIESTIAECERLSGIVDNLLFVARVDAARESIERKLIDARAAVEKIATFYQTLAEDRNVAIHCSGEGEIYVDPALFERALGNLMDNALRFTPEGGTIQISITVKAAHSEVTVSDN